jgi:hypothetical protein
MYYVYHKSGDCAPDCELDSGLEGFGTEKAAREHVARLCKEAKRDRKEVEILFIQGEFVEERP